MRYILSYRNPSQHLLDIEVVIPGINSKKLVVNLPIWRPGRYEEGNFAKNIRGFEVVDAKGKPLPFKKVQSHQWEIETRGEKEVRIRYKYYCTRLDAGGCWVDEEQFYVNPIHCFIYVEGWEAKPVSVELIIPKNYTIACGLAVEKGNVIRAADYHTMVDSPILASATMQHNFYENHGIKFHIWFQGSCHPDWDRILRDFKGFTDAEIAFFGTLPAKEYHFMYQLLPYEFHHGVEHTASTVIAMGPGYLLNERMYDDFLGISCHELFHAWNVKTIRPMEMVPYRYSEKNYSRLGYVYEGITTYYGNLILYRSKGFDAAQYFRTLDDRIQKHYHNYGRFNQSVGDASFDTWLDGYVDGIPHRKTNIYTEGCIVSLLLDLTIRMETKDAKSLDDVMRKLYHDACKKGYKGFSEADLLEAVEDVAGCSYQNFFDSFVYGTKDTQPLLEEALNYIGCDLSIEPSFHIYENYLGFKLDTDHKNAIVKIVAPNSPAEAAGLAKDDEIIAVNGWRVEHNFEPLCRTYYQKGLTLAVFSKNKLKALVLKESKQRFYGRYSVIQNKKATKQQQLSCTRWASGINH